MNTTAGPSDKFRHDPQPFGPIAHVPSGTPSKLPIATARREAIQETGRDCEGWSLGKIFRTNLESRQHLIVGEHVGEVQHAHFGLGRIDGNAHVSATDTIILPS